MDTDAVLRLIEEVAAEVVTPRFRALTEGQVHEKKPGDLVTVADHEAEHPELAGAAAAYDLFRPEFDHSCLNRLQLRNTLQMVDLTDQAGSLIFAGTLANPIAAR